jgi:aminomethyltransferase
MDDTIAREYAAAQTGSVMIDASAWGRLQITGKTRLDFLHRLSTNDVAKLQVGQGAATVFTTPIARMIDRTIVYVYADDVMMLTSHGNQGRVLAWLKKYIFFNDDVQIKDQTDTTGMISIYGAASNQVIRRISGEDLSTLSVHHWHEGHIDGREVMIARADPVANGGFHLIFDRSAIPQVWQALIEAGAVPITEQTYQVLRVEAGHPEFGHELSDDYIPLEANLWSDVSFTKGCYTGQEIIARMESRQRLTKHLIGLRFDDEVALPAALQVDDNEVGLVTSVIRSPAHGWIGLGYVKSAYGSAGQVVQSLSGERMVTAHVAVLPFKFD